MRKLFDWLLLIAVVGVAGYLIYAHPIQVRYLLRMAQNKVAPCSSPLTYSVVAIDPHFAIATSTLVSDLKEAEAIWENPSGKNFFSYVPTGGDVSVSLVYDERQASTDTLTDLGMTIDESKASYDSLRARYDSLSATIKSEQAQYQSALSVYQKDLDAYNAEVAHWNSVGGAPRSEYARLGTEKSALQSRAANITALEDKINANIDTLNALATQLNQLIVHLNLNVDQYNQAGAAAGEFEEGLYEQKSGVQTITIYEFSSHNQLVRVLAHEMGHALGLEHVSDPQAIMYMVNKGTELRATSADMAELDAVCRLK